MPKTDKYFRGCCGVHVTKLAYLIGLLGSLFEFLSLIYIFVGSFFSQIAPWYHYLLNAFSLITYFSLMLAVKRERQSLFWPYLIGNSLCLFLDMVLIIALLTYRSDLILHKHPEINQIKERENIFLSMIYAVFVTLSAIFNIYCIRVAWKAKQYYRQMNTNTASVYHLTGSKPYRPSMWRQKEAKGLVDV